MPDLLVKGQILGCSTAVAYAVTTETVAEAVLRHDCDPVAAHALGRAMTASILTAAALGDRERLNVRWAYEGALRNIVVDTGPDGATRAFIAPNHLADVADEGELYGAEGSLHVMRSREGLILSQSTIRTELLEVVEDLNHFLCVSDQVESAMVATIALAPDPKSPIRISRGLLLQALPDCDLIRFQALRDRIRSPRALGWMGRPDESDNLVENLLHSITDEVCDRALIRLEPAATPVFRCNCDAEKMGAVLRALPYEDRMDILRKREPLTVTCRFCGRRYTLSIEDCIRAWNYAGPPPP
ncbi:MAG: Hsp33 family molecular chaperone HslO [Kiritimatiellae bacterium]|nr:Hsp33 family molecular chaperone HslO [Kiritimatiellia bacterium]MDW8457937.1 Hsp33 family molecular chaperone HslO [Verrucomicrobiota bacterium]